MLGQVIAAQFDLERMIGELTRSGAGVAIARDQLRALVQLQKQVGQAGPSALVTLRGDISAAVAQTQAIANQSRAAAASIEAAEIATVAEAAAAARRTVDGFMTDFYERKIFDPYLRFSSPDDEAQYRKREAGYRAAIDAARAKGTPEGDLEAMSLQRRQLLDAGNHGADKSPDFAPMLDALGKSETDLRSALGTAPAALARSPSEPTGLVQPDKPSDIVDVQAVLRAAGVTPGSAPTGEPAALMKISGVTAIAKPRSASSIV